MRLMSPTFKIGHQHLILASFDVDDRKVITNISRNVTKILFSSPKFFVNFLIFTKITFEFKVHTLSLTMHFKPFIPSTLTQDH